MYELPARYTYSMAPHRHVFGTCFFDLQHIFKFKVTLPLNLGCHVIWSDLGNLFNLLFSMEVCIHKPNTSRPANSERYIVCKWKRPDTDNILQYLLQVNLGS